jgi:peptidoglycan/LPS O-acetylase OafA/YrhL
VLESSRRHYRDDVNTNCCHTTALAQGTKGDSLARESTSPTVVRSQVIDILRAVAVLLVLGAHMRPCPESTSMAVHQFTTIWNRGGWVGVDLFFVLSGFLVSGLLFAEHARFGTVSPLRFLARRGFKIYPAFGVMIALTVVERTWHHQPPAMKQIAAELLFFQNYSPGLWIHTWSLAVEEHFYLLLALLFFVLSGKNRLRSLPGIFAFVAIVCLLLRLGASGNYALGINHFPSHLRIDSLFFGVLLAYWNHRWPVEFKAFARRFRLVLLFGGALLLAPAFLFEVKSHDFIYTFGFVLFYLGGGAILLGLLAFEIPDNRLTRAFAFAGSRSYSIYLWHVPVLAWLVPQMRSVTPNWFVYCATYLAGSVLVGLVLGSLIEFPALKLRDNLVPKRASKSRTSVAPAHPAASSENGACSTAFQPSP